MDFLLTGWRLHLIFLLESLFHSFLLMNVLIKSAPAKCYRKAIRFLCPLPFGALLYFGIQYITIELGLYILILAFLFLIALVPGRMKPVFSLFLSIFYVFHFLVSRNIAYSVYSLISRTSMYTLQSTEISRQNAGAFTLLILCIFLLFYGHFSQKHSLRRLAFNTSQLSYVTTCHCVLTIFLYFSGFGTRYTVTSKWLPGSMLVTSLCLLVLFLLILYYGLNLAKTMQYDLRSKVMEQQFFSQRAIYQAKKAIMDESDTFKHAYRELILSVEYYLKNDRPGDALAELQKTGPTLLESLPSIKRYSNNAVVDSLFFELAQRCKENKIELEGLVYMPEQIDISDDILHQIFSILTQNALEACLAMPSGISRFIRIHSAKNNDWVTIQIENSFGTPLIWKEDSLVSTKKDSGHKGQSLAYLQEIMDDIGCMLQFNVDQALKVFTASITIR